uniref:Anaphase-promoting complex subunit 4 WD40 domain-containing protein n=1 Tax=Rhodosorus marinus TaxID=101924 RepID=A0A7S3ED33_9RHOD|mmetsp:Transcript_27037/g.105160  ORF Transcript_27037/g.105160 Transcript_27037/m.105160 type:complete len:451 (+) Transcript_27037:533-1885(+)
MKIMDDNVDFDSLSGSTEDSIVTFEDPTEADENQMAIDVPDNCANSMTSTEFVQSIPSLTKHHGDITWEDYQNGVDMQGIDLAMLGFSCRDTYRMHNAQSVYLPGLCMDHPRLSWFTPSDAEFFSFNYSTRRVSCSIGHTQLRHLVVSTSQHDVYAMCKNSIMHWNASRRKESSVLNMSSPEVTSRGLRHMTVTTIAAIENLVMAGGLHGEVVVKDLNRNSIVFADHISTRSDPITNAIDCHWSPQGQLVMMTSNNDGKIRMFDTESFSVFNTIRMGFAVNHATRQPNGGKLLCVAGDHEDGRLVDVDTGKPEVILRGHIRNMFATAWHPDGSIIATGNEDNTCRIWDVRNPARQLGPCLPGFFGAIRSLRFTNDGKFLIMSDNSDYVYIYLVGDMDFQRKQEIDLFGLVSGVTVSPDDELLTVGVVHKAAGRLLEFERKDWRKSSSCLI